MGKINNKSLNEESYISVYVRNKDITPSSYYRIIQYINCIEGNILIRELVPTIIYRKQLNMKKNNIIYRGIIGILYYITIIIRCTFFLIYDCKKKPNKVVVSKTFCPKYTPIIIRKLIKTIAKKTTLYWDFDDYIFENGEISASQAKILQQYSKKIIVTNNFLKSKIDEKYRAKVKLLPTTDGDLQGFNKKLLLDKRLNTLNKELRLVWVATSGNIPHLMKVIKSLDIAADIIKKNYGKNVILSVVCNKPLEYCADNIIVQNILWSRDIAREEIYNAHIGIMPLINNDFSLGKGAFKLVQYMSTGLPIIASKVGFNESVVDDKCGRLVYDDENTDGWINAILDICKSEEIWIELSENSYDKWKNKFNFERNLLFWKQILQDK